MDEVYPAHKQLNRDAPLVIILAVMTRHVFGYCNLSYSVFATTRMGMSGAGWVRREFYRLYQRNYEGGTPSLRRTKEAGLQCHADSVERNRHSLRLAARSFDQHNSFEDAPVSGVVTQRAVTQPLMSIRWSAG
jgi:hypothetical protein